MRGPIYTVSHDGRVVRPYVDVSAPDRAGWCSQALASAASRGWRCTRSSAGVAVGGTGSSTRSPTPATPGRRIFCPAGGSRTQDTVRLHADQATEPQKIRLQSGGARRPRRYEPSGLRLFLLCRDAPEPRGTSSAIARGAQAARCRLAEHPVHVGLPVTRNPMLLPPVRRTGVAVSPTLRTRIRRRVTGCEARE
jgi:hypothetical protein